MGQCETFKSYSPEGIFRMSGDAVSVGVTDLAGLACRLTAMK